MTLTSPARFAVALAVLAFLGTLIPTAASAETINCTAITSVPAVISTQGVYCLTGNVTSSSMVTSAIAIQANNVVFDLNGFKLAGNGGPSTAAFGIHAINRQNITIRNGTIRGFRQSMVLEGATSRGHLVEHIRAESNYEVGIQVNGAGCVIRDNQIVNTGGTTLFGPNAPTFGIYASGTSPRILNNDIAIVVGVGIFNSTGIYVVSGTDGFIVNNRIAGVDDGINVFATGTKCRDNLVSVLETAILRCQDAGNNH